MLRNPADLEQFVEPGLGMCGDTTELKQLRKQVMGVQPPDDMDHGHRDGRHAGVRNPGAGKAGIGGIFSGN